MTPISRGFGGRRRDDVDPSRIPPGQYRGVSTRLLLRGTTRSRSAMLGDEFNAADDVSVELVQLSGWYP
jgi:hypothetical protein